MNEPAEFVFGDGLTALGVDLGEGFEPFITRVVQEAELAANLPVAPDSGEQAGFLLAWPDQEAGVVACIASQPDGTNALAAAWPFARYGVAGALTILRVHHDEDFPLIRLYEGEIGSAAINVFDTFCAGASRAIRPGDKVTARMHGWAVRMEPASTEPIILGPDKLSAELREQFRETLERDGKVVFHTETWVSLIPLAGGKSPLHELRSPVKAVREGPRLPGLSTWVLTLTLARSADCTVDHDIEVSVTSAVWKGAAPAPGDAVQGLVWIQAAFE